MKNPVNLIRVIAAIIILFGLGHTAGYPWTPSLEGEAAMPVSSMKSISFNAMGATRTYWDFYLGFGLIITAFTIALGVMLWLISPLAATSPAIMRRVLAAYLVTFILNAVLSFKYFFVPPLVFGGLISALLTVSLVTLKQRA